MMRSESQHIGVGRIYARLIPVADGTLVIIADDRQPKGSRMLEREVLPYPAHVVAKHTAKLLKELNRYVG